MKRTQFILPFPLLLWLLFLKLQKGWVQEGCATYYTLPDSAFLFFSCLWTTKYSDAWEIPPFTRIPVRPFADLQIKRKTELKKKDKCWMKHEICCLIKMEEERVRCMGWLLLSFQNRKYLLHNAEAVQRETVLRNGRRLTFLHTNYSLRTSCSSNALIWKLLQ